MDIYSRYVTGWMIASRESQSLAKRLIEESCEKQNIAQGQLTIHADRGPSMRSKTVAQLLADLGITKTHAPLAGRIRAMTTHSRNLSSKP